MSTEVIAPSALGECLDDDTIVRFVGRQLSESHRLAVEAHLDACSDCLLVTCEASRFTPAMEVEVSSKGGARERHEHEGLKVGDLVGRYQLLEMVGRGAMGTVYEAHDPKLNRRVAVKVVRAGRLAKAEAHQRLLHEARAMAKLSHPNVVSVYDVGEVEGGVFVAMEFIRGITLATWMENQERPWREVLAVFLSAGEGLAAAHAAGIVHRDFKPENVLIDETGRVAVTDFGLALAFPSDASVASDGGHSSSLTASGVSSVDGPLTRTGKLVGTPRYMSAEQYSGGRADARSDQFSFAVALFEGVYRTRPFEGDTLAELGAAVVAGVVRRPKARAPADLPPSLLRILGRSLRPRASERYPSMRALLDELEHLQGRHFPASRWAAVALVVVTVTAATLVLARRHPPLTVSPSPPTVNVVPAPPKRTGARAPVLVLGIDNRSGIPALDGVVDAAMAEDLFASTQIESKLYGLSQLATELSLDPSIVDERLGRALATRDGNPVFGLRGAVTPTDGGLLVAIEIKEVGSDRVAVRASEVAAAPGGVIDASLRLARTARLALGEPERDVNAYVVTLSPAVDAVQAWHRARVLGATARYPEAIELLEKALQVDPHFAIAHATLGQMLYNSAGGSRALREMGLALEDGDKLGQRRRLAILGDFYAFQGQRPQAIAAYEQVLATWSGDPGAEISVTAAAAENSDWPLALQLAKRAVADHGTSVSAHVNLLGSYLGTSSFAEAVAEGEWVASSFPHLPPDVPCYLAMAYALSGQPDRVGTAFDQLSVLDPGRANKARADFALYQGRLDDAEALLRTAMATASAQQDEEARTELSVILASLLLRRGDKPGALAIAKHVTNGEATPRLAYALTRTLAGAGDTTAALALSRTWSGRPDREWGMMAQLVQGDVLRERGRKGEAVRRYLDALRVEDTWLGHARLGQAYLAAGDYDAAIRELSTCVTRSGEGAQWESPSLRELPVVQRDLARAKDAAHAPDAVDAYQELLNAEPTAQRDPFATEAQRRVAALRPATP